MKDDAVDKIVQVAQDAVGDVAEIMLPSVDMPTDKWLVLL